MDYKEKEDPHHVHLPVRWGIINPHNRAAKKNTSHGNEVLPQKTTHLTQRPCYQRGSPCKNPAGNRTTRRPPDHRTEIQIAVIWTCLPLIGSGQNHLRGTVKGGRRQGRQKKTSGNGQAWMFAKSQRAVENREKWRRLVVKSSVIPQRPSRLRDK